MRIGGCPHGLSEQSIASASSASSSLAMDASKEAVESALHEKLRPVFLNVVDISGGCGASFTVEIVSSAFEGKRLLERHRLVNTALAEEMKTIHALSVKKALTPQQWQEEAAKEAGSNEVNDRK